jgi:sialidase-1
MVAALALVAASAADGLVQTDLFRAGTDRYSAYRIPALIATKAGTLLAFCEGRKAGKSDSGDIDLLLKRSTDGGKTWSSQQVIWDEGENTCGNPCPVVDQQSGTISLLMTHNLGSDTEKAIHAKTARGTRTVWLSQSSDDGKSWSRPKGITRTTKDPSWGWYATGPGIGIQIKHGEFARRLVVPCDHSSDDKKDPMGSHIIYSDDGGHNWKLGGVARPKMNECQVVELADGRGTLLLDMRSYRGEKRRAHSISTDGAVTWSEPKSHPELIEPVCQASIFRFTWPSEGGRSRILFSNPADERRRNLTVRLSYDEAKTWPVSKTLHTGPAAYSSLAGLADGTIACLYERGEKDPYERITFATFPLGWLTQGKDVR